MTRITSKNSQVYKKFQRLLAKKYRDQMGRYIVEGENLIEEAVKNGAHVEEILVRDGEEAKLPGGLNQNKIFIAEKKLFRELAQTETSQGIMAAVKKPQPLKKEDFIRNGARGNFVVLDRLQDPGNIGTIIRTADAAGYGLVVAMKGTADLFSPKVVRAAAGSLFRVPLLFLEEEEELIEFARAAGKRLAATCLKDSRYYYEEDLRRDIALIIGNEGNGIRESLIEKADIKIKIPMMGNIESLNASVAAAIIMYESVRAGAQQQGDD